MSGDILAVVNLSGGNDLKVVRLQSGLLALCSASNVIAVGTLRDLAQLGQAITALTKALGPHEGGTNG